MEYTASRCQPRRSINLTQVVLGSGDTESRVWPDKSSFVVAVCHPKRLASDDHGSNLRHTGLLHMTRSKGKSYLSDIN